MARFRKRWPAAAAALITMRADDTARAMKSPLALSEEGRKI
jgi:hypothetical protein